MPSRPTVYDVAARAGVSIATVSFAFRQPERVRAATREAVLTAAHELGYVPSASARGLAEGNTGAFGLYAFDLMLSEHERVPDAALATAPEETIDPLEFPLYVDEIERGFALECRSTGRALLLASGAPSGSDVYDIAGRVEGLAVFPGQHQLDALTTIAEKIPVLSFSSAPGKGPLHRIYVDNRAGVRQLVEHVINAHGTTDLAFVSDLTMLEFQERRDGFDEAMDALAPGSPAERPDRRGLVSEGWRAHLAEAIASGSLPRALICQNDQLACEVLDILAHAGVDVPGDVIVTGFDGVLAGRLSSPTLTTVRQPLESMGRLAVRVLTRQLKKRTAEPEHYKMPLNLTIRDSCGCGEPESLSRG